MSWSPFPRDGGRETCEHQELEEEAKDGLVWGWGWFLPVGDRNMVIKQEAACLSFSLS